MPPADSRHRFAAEEDNWGFIRFHALRKLYNVQDTQKRPIIEDEAADVTVFVRVIKDPTGVLWHNFAKYSNPFLALILHLLIVSSATRYDSKKETGYVGLKKPRGDSLHECSPAISFLYPILPSSKLEPCMA